MSAELTWNDIKIRSWSELQARGLDGIYRERLKFEIAEIEKQGAEAIWLGRVRRGNRYASNPNKLLLPWLLGMVDEDPIASHGGPVLTTARAAAVAEFRRRHGFIPRHLIRDADMPDIDIDCLPAARNHIKQYAIDRYGRDFGDSYGSVCSVGTWQTYKFRSALIDVAVALGYMGRGQVRNGQSGAGGTVSDHSRYPEEKDRAEYWTSQMPDEVDELREGGNAVCKNRIRDGDDERECGCVYGGIQGQLVCPRCGDDKRQTDGPTLARLIEDYPIILEFKRRCEYNRERLGLSGGVDVLNAAVNLIGRVRNMGMHAGAMIITDRPLYGNVPLARSGRNGLWVSIWTEGRNTQLSKLGYVKWDWLGLKTLEYIHRCCRLIEENRGISFGPNLCGWDDIDPLGEFDEFNGGRHAGYYYDGVGRKHYINLDDPHALKLANELKTDGVFQFDTDLAKSILANGVRTFEDLMLFNAMGHPGPMASIPEAIRNRDDRSGSWRKHLHPIMLEILEPTYGVIVYQEQLQALWQRVAGFTAPEAQEARKAMAKKWVHKFKAIEEKWIGGAAQILGHDEAMRWWEKMVSFGRYAFNKSHAVQYCLVAFRCLWLKAHFAPEYWAAVMSSCHPDKLARYMAVARTEKWEPTEITYCGRYKGDGCVRGVRFDTININNLSSDFTVTGDTVNPGLIGIKGIGKKAAAAFQGRNDFASIDELVQSNRGRQSKVVMERFIKLGAFRHLPGHENSRAVWMWYQYRYVRSGKAATALRRSIRQKLLQEDGWTDEAIMAERQRQISEYKRQYPKRSKIPSKIMNWTPTPDDRRERVMALFKDDFTVAERLKFQRLYLGYCIDSPLDLYHCDGCCTIGEAKELAKNGSEIRLAAIITDVSRGDTRNGKPYIKMIVDDGVQKASVFIWSNELAIQDHKVLRKGHGVCMVVDYDVKWGTFNLCRGEVVHKLVLRDVA